MLDSIIDSDYDSVKLLWDEIKCSGLAYADRLSVFWSSYHQADDQAVGRLPPLDRLDLIRCGILLAGIDKRNELTQPSEQEIILASAEFLISLLLTHEKLTKLITEPEKIINKGPRYFTKSVLFPVRLLFTLDQPTIISSNKEAIEYFKSTEFAANASRTVQLIDAAYLLRNAPLDQPITTINAALLQTDLLTLYLHCIKRYSTALKIMPNNTIIETLQVKLKSLQAVLQANLADNRN
jgi:hypothetical protein